LAVAAALLAAPVVLAAQDSIPARRDSAFIRVQPRDTAEARRDSAFVRVQPRDVDSLGRPIIRHIEVHRSDIFTEEEAKGWLARLVNGLHFTTLPRVVSREILFKEGEPYDSLKAAETARNLRTLGIFRRVQLDTVTTDSGFVLKVFTQDGWTTQADLRFRSAGSQTDWQVALIERNLIGTGTRFATRYRDTPDRSLINFQFLQPRLVKRSVSLGLRYEDRSDGVRGQVAIERPFFSLSDKAGVYTLFDIRNERVLRFRDGVSDPSDSLRRRFVIGRVDAGYALRRSSRGYLRVGFTAQLRRDDYAIWPSNTTERSVTAAVGPFLEWRRANFVVARGFTRFGRDEDVDVSNLFRVQAVAAPEVFGYDRDGIGLLGQFRIGTQIGRRQGFAWVDTRANGLYSSAGLDSGSVQLAGTVVLTPANRHLLIGHADIGWIKKPQPATEFDLGFSTGPRGFPIHAFTGDRTYFTTAEYRFIFGEDVLKALDLGVASFVDHGGAWYSTQSRRTGTNIGLGLRLSPSRAADANPTRLDLAYRFKNDQEKAGWVFVIASGLVFSTNPRGL
jgi:hypothetical protein